MKLEYFSLNLGNLPVLRTTQGKKLEYLVIKRNFNKKLEKYNDFLMKIGIFGSSAEISETLET